MKFALIVLSVLVVFTDQQFYHHQPSTAAERLFWLSRYYSPPPAFDYYNYQPVNYADNQDDDGSFYPFMPPSPPEFSQNLEAEPYLNTMENPNDVEEEQFPDVQARRKIVNRFRSRYRPSSFQPKPQKDPRVVINLATRTNLLNRKVKTITFTWTSSVTITTVKSCIPSSDFYVGAADVTCRRKKRGIVAFPDIKPEDSQFVITPSDIQPVEPTDLTSFDDTEEIHQWTSNDRSLNHGIVSSKDEDVVEEVSLMEVAPAEYLRGKRFFHLVTTTTLFSYTFIPTTITKTVNLLNTFYFYYGGQLICRPEGYAVCPYTSPYYG